MLARLLLLFHSFTSLALCCPFLDLFALAFLSSESKLDAPHSKLKSKSKEAFARLLGVGVGDAEGTLDVELVKYADHDVVRNVMKSEASEDLKAKAKEVTAKLRAVELESIQDYVAESENLSQLHAQIEGCDEVLGSMEKLLSGFKDHLGKIGGEMKARVARPRFELRNRKRPPIEGTPTVDFDGVPGDVGRGRAQKKRHRRAHFALRAEPLRRGVFGQHLQNLLHLGGIVLEST